MPPPPLPSSPLLFLDYDGTLAPLVDDPAEAHPHPDVTSLLPRIAARHPLYIVTGRDLAALGRLLPLELPALGLHGAEEGVPGGEARRQALEPHAETLDRLRAGVPEMQGVRVEDKGGSAFAVHYRGAADPEAARAALASWVEGVPEPLEPIWGKRVLELRVRGVTKGTAVARHAAAHPERTPVYLGDDVTDEDAFQALAEINPEAVTVKVGEGETAARFRLPDVEAVVAYLSRFAEDGP